MLLLLYVLAYTVIPLRKSCTDSLYMSKNRMLAVLANVRATCQPGKRDGGHMMSALRIYFYTAAVPTLIPLVFCNEFVSLAMRPFCTLYKEIASAKI